MLRSFYLFSFGGEGRGDLINHLPFRDLSVWILNKIILNSIFVESIFNLFRYRGDHRMRVTLWRNCLFVFFTWFRCNYWNRAERKKNSKSQSRFLFPLYKLYSLKWYPVILNVVYKMLTKNFFKSLDKIMIYFFVMFALQSVRFVNLWTISNAMIQWDYHDYV